tara:strand:- start:56 stop:403 length:348 start_codon:yes stop_codon:yes gene_type:complete
VVYDRASGLMWQQSGSDNRMDYKNAQTYVKNLNCAEFAGYNDWRFPTLEEAMSLMEPTKNNYGLYIDSVFDTKHTYVYTSDLKRASHAWIVKFHYGYCSFYKNRFRYDQYVRAVR